MNNFKKLLGYLWVGIWTIGTILVFFLEVYICVKFYPHFISLGIGNMIVYLLLGLIVFGLIATLGYLILQIILPLTEDNSSCNS